VPRTNNAKNTPAIVDATWHGQAWITLRGLPWTPNTIKFTVLVDGQPYPNANDPLIHQLWDLPVGQENAPWISVAWAIDLGHYSVGYHEVSFLCTTFTYGPIGGGSNGGTTDSFGFRYDVNVFNPYSYPPLYSLRDFLNKVI